jgi:hypothetical protein
MKPYLMQRLNRAHPPVGVDQINFDVPLLEPNPNPRRDSDQKMRVTEAAMNVRKQIFDFDYMGSAEFEFGAVGDCLSRVYAATDYVLVKVPFESEPKPPDPELSAEDKKKRAYIRRRNKKHGWTKNYRREEIQKDDVFIICHKAQEKDVVEIITKLRHNRYAFSPMKEPIYAGDDPFTLPEEDRRQVGVLDLCNDYFIFFERHAFIKTARLMGFTQAQVEVCLTKEVAPVIVPYAKGYSIYD